MKKPPLISTQRRLFRGTQATKDLRKGCVYFSELLIEVNLAFSVVPRPLTATIIAIEMPAAIRPYSMAVAPDSSCKKRTKSLDIKTPW